MSITNGIVSSKIYDKRDDFNFEIIHFLFLDGYVPRSTSYGVYILILVVRSKRLSGVVWGWIWLWCLVVVCVHGLGLIMVYGYGFLFNYTAVGQASDSMAALKLESVDWCLMLICSLAHRGST